MPPTRNQSGDWLDKGTGLKGAHLEGVHLRLPGYGNEGPTLEIYQYKEVVDQAPVKSNLRGYGHIAFEVDDIQALVKKIIKHGGSLCGELTERYVPDIGVLRFVYARDPEGNIIELQNWNKKE